MKMIFRSKRAGKRLSKELEIWSMIWKSQIEYQMQIVGEPSELDGIVPPLVESLPVDSIYWFNYHIRGMLEEIGELTKADKRWKTHRRNQVNEKEKREEIADVFIEAINLAIFSGLTEYDVYLAVFKKMEQNAEKLKEERKAENEKCKSV